MKEEKKEEDDAKRKDNLNREKSDIFEINFCHVRTRCVDNKFEYFFIFLRGITEAPQTKTRPDTRLPRSRAGGQGQ